MRTRRPFSASKSFHARKHSRGSFASVLTFGLIVLLVVWLGVRFFRVIFSDIRSENATATIQIEKGRAEFVLNEETTWNRALSDQKFLEGDSVKTAPASRVSLEVLNGNTVILDEASELTFEKIDQKSSGRKTVLLNFKEGRMWAQVGDTPLESNSSFQVKTTRGIFTGDGSMFDLSTSTKEDVLHVIKGSIDIDVFTDKLKEETKLVHVGVGQKITLNPTTLEQIKSGKDIVEGNNSDFTNSEWHLQNLEKFSPQEAAQIRRNIEVQAAANTTQLPVANDVLAPTIISPKNGDRIPATVESITIEGTAPVEAFQIIVNGYTLTKFQPGDRKWTYFASRNFGTMVPGDNKYTVIAVMRDGKQSSPTEINVFYEATPVAAPATATPEAVPAGTPAGVTNPTPVAAAPSNFPTPVILNPVVPDATQAYETSSEVVTISGMVDPQTTAVEVNGFRLQKFAAGQTEFKYLANARYGNLKEGENVFEVTAFGPEGKKSSTSIRVIYKPVSL